MNDNITFVFYSGNYPKEKVRILTTTEKAEIIKKFIEILNDSENLMDILPKLMWEKENDDKEVFIL